MAFQLNSEIIGNLVTIGAVTLGWFLGETTGWIKKKWELKTLKEALRTEIKDCSAWLQRNKLTLEYVIQQTVLGQLPEQGPVKVPTHIYEKHFPEVSIHLSSSERISFNSIHNLICSSHEQQQRLLELRQVCTTDKSRLKEFTEVLEAAYHNVSMAIWQIDYHITHGAKVDIHSLTGKDALEIDKGIDNRLKEIIAGAKNLGLKSIHKKYYET